MYPYKPIRSAALPPLATCHQLESAVVTARMSLADDERLWDEALHVLASLPAQTRAVTLVHELRLSTHVLPLLDHVMAGFDWPRCERALAHCAAPEGVPFVVRVVPERRPPMVRIWGDEGLGEER